MTDTKKERQMLKRVDRLIRENKKRERRLAKVEHGIERSNADMATVREARAKVAEYRHSRMNA